MKKEGDYFSGLEIDKCMFRLSPGFAAGSLIILGLLVALYTLCW